MITWVTTSSLTGHSGTIFTFYNSENQNLITIYFFHSTPLLKNLKGFPTACGIEK